MKTIPCSYKDCNQRRIHFSIPDENRDHQMVEVTDEHDGGEVFCSLTCAILAGKMSVKADKESK
jgi:hypothetical protein